MSGLSATMLRSLLTGRTATPGPNGSAASSSAGVDFAAMLSSARSGEVTSTRPVQAAAGVEKALTPEQLRRIGVAADRAESAGMTSAVVLIDGQAVKLDVLGRQVEAVVDPRAVALTGVDGVLAAPPSSLAEQVSGQSGLGLASAAGAMEQQLLSKLASSTGLRISRPGALANSVR